MKRILLSKLTFILLAALSLTPCGRLVHAEETSTNSPTDTAISEEADQSRSKDENRQFDFGPSAPINVRKAQAAAKHAELLSDRERALLKEEQQRAAAGQAQVESMRQELEEAKRQLAVRKQQLDQAAHELAKRERDSALPPLESGELKVYSLASLPAKDAAEAIQSLFGAQALRVAIDDRTNSLIVFGKADWLPTIDALLTRLDEKATRANATDGTRPSDPNGAEANRSLLLRVFWLADGLPSGEGSDPGDILPVGVLRALEKLGLADPRLVTQTVTSLAVRSQEDVQFSSDVPAVVFGKQAGLAASGKIRLTEGSKDRAAVQLKIQVTNPGFVCGVQGSLAAPIGHYMVLGTANSVIGDQAPMHGMGRRMGPERGPAFEAGGEFGPVDAAGPEPPGRPNYSTSRFAFVVQVIEGESFPPEE
jgi:hypothetical protein